MQSYIIGMDLGGTTIKSALFTTGFQQVAENRSPTQADKPAATVLQNMLHNAHGLLQKAGVPRQAVRSMGIGVPGLLDVDKGISRFSPNFSDWKDVPVAPWFAAQLGVPVYVDNDVRMHLYGEWRFGAGKGAQNMVLLTIGTGLGAGVVIDGHALYGATGSVGEIGHMHMLDNGRPCRCGSSGCLGRYVSALGMLRTFREKLAAGQRSIILDWVQGDPSRITAKMLSQAYDQGDAAAVDTLRETGEWLGYGLVNVINLYNPAVVIVGGGVAAAGERLLQSARALVRSHALAVSRDACRLVTAALGDSAGTRGAAVRAAERYAAQPHAS